jgi:hypothetical protein
MVATDVETGFQWPVKVIEAPKNPGPDYEHSKHELDGAVSEAFDRYSVWRAYSTRSTSSTWLRGGRAGLARSAS